MMTGRAFAGASASDRRNCSLNLDASPPAVQTYPANPSSEGGALAVFTWTGHRASGRPHPVGRILPEFP